MDGSVYVYFNKGKIFVSSFLVLTMQSSRDIVPRCRIKARICNRDERRATFLEQARTGNFHRPGRAGTIQLIFQRRP